MSLKRLLEQTERANAIGSGVGYLDPISATFLALTALTGGKTITEPIKAKEQRAAIRRQQAGQIQEADQIRDKLRADEAQRRGRAEAIIGAGGVSGGSAQLANLSGAFSLLDDLGVLNQNLTSSLYEGQRQRRSAKTAAFSAGFGALVKGGTQVATTALTAGFGGGAGGVDPDAIFGKPGGDFKAGNLF
ncbi:MAG: hypothetical protein KDH09_15175 [Chrysiogenetes bacterium]|nr:hypothetical protein [Chrysiogenetes bacterium]